MNWELEAETLKLIYSYAASALISMLTVHCLIQLLQWLQKGRGQTPDQGKSERK